MSRELHVGRRVLVLDGPPSEGIVLATQGETAWVWLNAESMVWRIDGRWQKRIRLFSGELGKISKDERGYRRVTLGRGHALANSGGWQYAHRLAMVPSLGRLPTTREVAVRTRGEKGVASVDSIVLLPIGEASRRLARRSARQKDGRFLAGVVEAPVAVQGALW